MIICVKCKEPNPPELTKCLKCGTDLLPGENIGSRLGSLMVGFVAGAIGLGIGLFLAGHPEIVESSEICLLTNPAAWFFAAIASPITGIASALKKTPIYIRYENRAIRHQEGEPQQALDDFTKALELAPEKYRAKILKSRAALYAKLGQDEKATEDQLAYTYSGGAFEDTSSFVRLIGGDKDTYVSSAIKDERKRMLASGKIKALGFCKACGHAVELNEKLKCALHPKLKLQNITFVMPKDVEATISKVEAETIAIKKKNRKVLTIWLIILGVLLLVCVLSTVLASLAR